MLFVLMCISAMANIGIPSMGIMYMWSTIEHVPATIMGPSTFIAEYC